MKRNEKNKTIGKRKMKKRMNKNEEHNLKEKINKCEKEKN